MTKTTMDPTQRRDLWRQLVADRVPLAEIARRYGVSRERVRQVVTDRGKDNGWYTAVRVAQQSYLVNKAVQLWQGMERPSLVAISKAMGASVERTRRFLVMGGIDLKTKTMPDHGTVSRYVHYGCRCEECRKANATYHREYRQRKEASA